MQRIVLLACAVLAAGLAWLLWPGERGTEPEILAPPSAPDSAASASASRPAATRREEPATPVWAVAEESLPVPRPVAVIPGGILRGRIVWERTFQPAAGVGVRLTHRWLDTVLPGVEDDAFFRSLNDPILLPGAATTDARGEFVLDQVPESRTLFLLIAVGGRLVDIHLVPRLPAPGETVTMDELRLATRARLGGRLLLAETGREGLRPAAFARVRLVDSPILDDPLVDPARRARERQRVAEFRAEDRSAPAERERDRMLPFPETTTSGTGSFTLEGARPGAAQLLVQAPGHEPWWREVALEPGGTLDLGTIVVGCGPALRGRVVDAEGRPVAGAEVRVALDTGIDADPEESFAPGSAAPLRPDRNRIGNARDSLSIAAPTDQDGRFVLHPPAAFQDSPGHWFHVRRIAGLGWEHVRVLARRRADGSPPQGLEIRMPPLGRLRIGILDAAGANVTGGRAWLFLRDEHGSASVPLPEPFQPRGGPDGFETADLPPGGYLLRAYPPGHAPVVDPLMVRPGPGATSRTFRALPTFPVRVTVLDAADRPVEGTTVYAAFRGEDPRARLRAEGRRFELLSDSALRVGTTDAAGVLDLDGAWEANAAFAGRAPGYAVAITPELRLAPGTGIVLRVERPAVLQGVVVQDGAPRPGPWRITLSPALPTLARYGPWLPLLPTRATPARADGSFEFRDLPALSWLIARDGEPEPAVEVALRPGTTTHQALELHPPRSRGRPVEGTATVDGAPAEGLVFRIWVPQADGDTTTHAVFAGPGGTFRAAPRGDPLAWQLERSVRGARTILAAGTGTPVGGWRNATIAARTGSFVAEVRGPDGQRLTHRSVTLVEVESRRIWARSHTDAAGCVRFDGLGTGLFLLRPQGFGQDHACEPATVEVLPGRTTETILHFRAR